MKIMGKCDRKNICNGCVKTDGHPFGGKCIAAECIKRGGSEELKNIHCQMDSLSDCLKIIMYIWEIKLKCPAAAGVMALWRMRLISLCANMDATVRSRR